MADLTEKWYLVYASGPMSKKHRFLQIVTQFRPPEMHKSDWLTIKNEHSSHAQKNLARVRVHGLYEKRALEDEIDHETTSS